MKNDEDQSPEINLAPPWLDANADSLRHRARAQWLAVFTLAFAVGALLPIGLYAKLGMLAALALLTVGYYVAAARSFMYATALQQEATGRVRVIEPKISEPKIVDAAHPPFVVTQEK